MIQTASAQNVVEVLLGFKLEECFKQIEPNLELRPVADDHRLGRYFARTGIGGVATFPVMMVPSVRKSVIREMWLVSRTRHKNDTRIIFMVCSMNFKKSKFMGSSEGYIIVRERGIHSDEGDLNLSGELNNSRRNFTES